MTARRRRSRTTAWSWSRRRSGGSTIWMCWSLREKSSRGRKCAAASSAMDPLRPAPAAARMGWMPSAPRRPAGSQNLPAQRSAILQRMPFARRRRFLRNPALSTRARMAHTRIWTFCSCSAAQRRSGRGFARMVRLGLDGAAPAQLQNAGRQAEAEMLQATGGVNTHKGALYALSLLLAAMGRHLSGAQESIFSLAAADAAALAPPVGTHGSQVRRRYGRPGAREEAMDGFPSLQALLQATRSQPPLGVLLWSMAHLSDSNLLYRGGEAGLAFTQNEAERILRLPAGAVGGRAHGTGRRNDAPQPQPRRQRRSAGLDAVFPQSGFLDRAVRIKIAPFPHFREGSNCFEISFCRGNGRRHGGHSRLFWPHRCRSVCRARR